MLELVNKLNEATLAYDQGLPIMSDFEWDNLYFSLLEKEKKLGYSLPNSPTQNIVYEVKNKLDKIEHNHPMLSMDKTKDIEEVKSKMVKNDQPILMMAKLDGLTCSLRYLNGELVSAETRGNGLIGEDILHNMRVLPSVPKKINYNEELIVDGEIICTWQNFDLIKEEFKHPRNFAAGSIRLLDSNECSLRRLTFVAWEIIKGFEDENSLKTRLEKISKLGFRTVPCLLTKEITAEILGFMQSTAEKIYPIDGLIFKYDDIKYGQSLGRTEHHFNNAIAYKFYDEIYETKLIDIEYSIGRTGILTPVAIFEPIEIDGTMVERATLHNISMTRELLGIPYKGQKIFVYKANMVTPQIKSGENPPENEKIEYFELPEICPVCGAKTIVAQKFESETLTCPNPLCEGQLISRLDYYCGKKGMDIRGLSVNTLEKLVDWGWINNLIDIYSLSKYKEEWIKKDGFGEKSVQNILDNIEKSKNVPLYVFITALGIPFIGLSVAKSLCSQIHSYEEFREKINNKFDFSQYDTFGENKTAALLNFNYIEADEIYKKLNIVEKENTNTEKSLNNLVFCITGTLNNFKNRTGLKNYIEDHGGKVVSSISNNVDYLINNNPNSNSAKNQKANKLGVKVITEETLLSL